jgi:hypothetical protein
MSGRLIISRHKSWHVWNRDNVERVEKDEKLQAEQKAEEEKRAKVAEGEVRLALLRKRAQRMRGGEEEEAVAEPEKERVVEEEKKPLNLFEDGEIEQVLLGGARAVESGARQRRLGPHNETESKSSVPKATDEEKFGAVEKHVPWYAGGGAVTVINEKVDRVTKEREDPLFVMDVARDTNKQLREMKERGVSLDQALVDVHAKKRQRKEEKKQEKKEKKHRKKSSEKTIEELRAERLEREKAEHERAKQLLRPQQVFGRATTPAKYNSGFFK